MLSQFFKTTTTPGGKARVVDLYRRYKQQPKTEGVRRLQFLNSLMRSGVPLTQERGRAYASLTLAPLPAGTKNGRLKPAVAVSRRPNLCRCGAEIPVAYTSDGRCEDCYAEDLGKLGIHAEWHGYESEAMPHAPKAA